MLQCVRTAAVWRATLHSETLSLTRGCAPIRTRLHFSRISRRENGDHGNHKLRHYSNQYPHGNQSTGLFDKPQFSSAEGFRQATLEALIRARDLVAEISNMADNERPSEEVAIKMDELSDVLCKVADLSECVRLVHPDPTFQRAAEKASLEINGFVEELNTDTSLHRSLLQFMKSREFSETDPIMRRTTELLMHDFEASGIHLDQEKRERVVELNNRILELSHQFMQNTTQPTIVSRDNCHPSLVKHFSSTSPSNTHIIAVDHVPYVNHDVDLYSHSYRQYFSDKSTQNQILEELLSSRHQVSVATGHSSFAQRTLKMTMAGDSETVRLFLETLSDKILPLARLEARELQRFNPSLTGKSAPRAGIPDLMPWDVNVCTFEANEKFFASQGTDLREYFSLGNTLKGLANLFRKLFGVTVETVPTRPGEVWDRDVIKLAFLREEGEGLLGYTYCDLFAREGKSITDCHFTIQGGRELSDGSYQTPVIAICCRFRRGNHGNDGHRDDPKSILLSRNDVENLFHEMGHALHSMLGRSRYQNVTGTRCSTDFAEIPSTLMEYFLDDSRVLESFARHHQTGRPIPRSYLSLFQHSGKLFPALDMQLHLTYALTDLLIHSNQKPPQQSVTDYATEIYRRYAPVRASPGVTWLLRFNHLYGYGARYYSYLWARAVSCLIWRELFSTDPFSRESGTKLHLMLQYGGGLPPNTLVREVLNFEPSVSDMVQALYSDIVEQRQRLEQFVTK